MSYAEFGQVVTAVAGLLLLALSGYGWANLRFRVPGTVLFILLTVAAALWCFGYAYEKTQITTDGFLMAARLEYLGLAFVPTLWLLVTLHWMDHPLATSRRLAFAVLGFSAAVVALVATNHLHHGWYASITPLRPGFARFVPGILYFPVFAVLASPFVVSSVLLLRRRRKVSHFRQKAGIILTVNIIPLAGAVVFQLGFRPGGLDPTIFSVIPTFAVLALGLFLHDFIRIVPIAREVVVESMEHPVLVFDDRGRLIDRNQAARPHLEAYRDALANPVADQGELSLTLDGVDKTFRFRRSPIRTQGGEVQGSVVLLTDVTEERRLLDELGHQASHDALTGVANRRHFEDHALGEITRANRHGGTVAVVLFDLDWFKSVNDQFGHAAGDLVLRSVVAIVQPRLRPYDLLARIGGEEFVVLMPEAHPVEAREAAERWRTALEATPQIVGGTVIPVTASFGVATLNDLPLTVAVDPRLRLDALMGLADKALYQAKAEGRNRVV